MNIYGHLKLKLEPLAGESAKGKWVSQTFVLEPVNSNGRILAFEAFGQELVEKLEKIEPGTLLSVRYEIESREYEGKYFTKLRAFGFSPISQTKLEI